MAKQEFGPHFDAYESVTVSDSSKALTSGTYADAQFATITVENAPLRFRLDGATTAPTATVGHVLLAGDVLELDRNTQIVNIRFIRRDGTDATLRVSYGT